MRILCVLLDPVSRSQESIQTLAECGYRLSPQISVRRDEAVFLEVSKCRSLYREESAVMRMRVILRRFGIQGRVSLADDVPTALALAQVQVQSKAQLPISVLPFYADPWGELSSSQVELVNAAQKMAEDLQVLGVRTIDAFSKLPERAVVARFRQAGHLCWLRVSRQNTAQDLPWKRWRAPEKIFEKKEFFGDEDCWNLEPLLFDAKTLLDRLMSRLHARGTRVSRLRFELGLEKHSGVKDPLRKWDLALLLPQGSSNGLLPVLRERLSADLARNPLEAPVRSIRIEVLETAPGRTAQSNFFHQSEEQEEALHSWVGRIAEKVGHHHVFRAQPVERDLPEKSWIKTLKVSSRATPIPRGERPLRILSPPERLERVGKNLSVGAQRWKMLDWEGPERIQGDWWNEDAYRRDYYRVETQTGERLWVFRDPQGLFLHGFFE